HYGDWPSLRRFEADLRMGSVAEWFVLRLAAPAEGDAVARFVGKAVLGRDRNSAAHPEGTIGHGGNRRLESRFDRGSIRLRHRQPTRWAIRHHGDQPVPHLWIVALADHLPNIGHAVAAESGMLAKRFVVGHH